MTQKEPEDVTAIFNEMIADIKDEFEEPTDVIRYPNLSDVDLAVAYEETRKALHAIDAVHERNPIGEAAELHSRWAAIQSELKKRFHPKPKKKGKK